MSDSLRAIEASAPPAFLRVEGASEGFELLPVEAADGDKPKGRRFNMTAYTGVPIRLGYGPPVVVDLAGLTVPRQDLPILRQHDADRIVGHSTDVEVTAQRVKLAGLISGTGEAAVEVGQLAANGFPWQASIGASVERTEFVDAGASVKVNGRTVNGPVYVARATTLREVSFVPLGADGATSATVAATLKGNPMTFEQWLAAKGFDPATLSDAQRTTLKLAFDAETRPAPPPVQQSAGGGAGTGGTNSTTVIVAGAQPSGGTFEQQMAAIEAENTRVEYIRNATVRACESNIGNPEKIKGLRDLCAAAVADPKTDTRAFDLALMRYDRDRGHLILSPQRPQVSDDVVTAAICKAGGLKTLEKDFDARTLDMADKRFKGGIGLHELIELGAEQNGYRGRVKGSLRTALQYAFQPAAPDNGYGYGIQASGPSTLSIPGILSNVANKFVREAFLFVEDTWRRITAMKAVNDFKTISTYSLTGDLQYEKVAPGGEIKHGTFGEETYTNKADTYAKLLGIDRQQLINDDLGALASSSRRLGRGGALKINDVFWTVFLLQAVNGTANQFFTAARGNYDDGATDSVMSLTGLANANALFMALNDPDGKPTGTTPATVLVPPALWAAAWTLLVGRPPGDTTSTISPFQGMFKLEMSRYLANASYTGFSAAAWYLLADPNDMPVIETVFVNGQEMPTIETADMDFNRLGIALRGYHDFGCALQEYRAGVKLKGAA